MACRFAAGSIAVDKGGRAGQTRYIRVLHCLFQTRTPIPWVKLVVLQAFYLRWTESLEECLFERSSSSEVKELTKLLDFNNFWKADDCHISAKILDCPNSVSNSVFPSLAASSRFVLILLSLGFSQCFRAFQMCPSSLSDSSPANRSTRQGLLSPPKTLRT